MINRNFCYYTTSLFIVFFCSLLFAHTEENKVYFNVGQYSLDEAQKERIDNNIESIKSLNQIILVGSTDPLGENSYNTWLGLKRAETVRDYLYLKHNIEFNKITSISSGIDRTVLSSNLKRRVEIRSSEVNESLTRNLSSAIQTQQSDPINNLENSKSKEDVVQIYKKIQELEDRLNLHINEQKEPTVKIQNVKNKIEENINFEIIAKDKTKDRASKTAESKSLAYELGANTYFADQSAKFNPSSGFNELLSEQRLSMELDIYKKLTTRWWLNLELGIRWNAYRSDTELNTIENWEGLGSRINIGLLNKYNHLFSYNGFIGLEQILSHSVDSFGAITPELESVVRLGFHASTRFINEYNFDLNIGPKFSFIFGLGDINQGYSYGILAKANIGKAKKYFLTLAYEQNHFEQDVRSFEVETLELGVGINF